MTIAATAKRKNLVARTADEAYTQHSFTFSRWNCRHNIDGSDVIAYVATRRGLEIIATTRQAEGIDARANAQLIIQAVNSYDRHALVIKDLISALELCLKGKGLTWAAEQEADISLRRAREVLGSSKL